MNWFVASLIFVITVVVWLLFAGYSWLFYHRSWKQAFKEASAIALIMLGLLIALAELQ